MSDVRAQVGELLDGIRPVITAVSVYKWEGDTEPQFWEFLRRAVLRRQLEAMDAICAMSDGGHGHFGVTLLRPAFEELVWIEFLSKNVEVARILVPELTRLEIAKSIRAQFSFGGFQSLNILGFEKKTLTACLRMQPIVEARIKGALLKLGWNRKQLLPTMKFLAKNVGRDKEYDYVYHATSRFVHFSTQELLRRVWGKHGEVHVSTKTFSRFWSNFALYWGVWVLMLLVIAGSLGRAYCCRRAPVTFTLSVGRPRSRPGEFHPEPLTDSDANLSIHPARANARRLRPSTNYRTPPVCWLP